MRVSIQGKGIEICKRLEDAGDKCRYGTHPEWADTFVVLTGRPPENAGVNSGLLAQAIFNDPSFLPTVVPGLPTQDSIVLVSGGLTIGQFTLESSSYIVPFDLGAPGPCAVALLSRVTVPQDSLNVPILQNARLVLQVTARGREVHLVSEPAVWAALLELYSLHTLVTLPPRYTSPKQPFAGAWFVLGEKPQELEKGALHHTLGVPDGLVVSARGITQKEVRRRVKKSIERLKIPNDIYRIDLLKRR